MLLNNVRSNDSLKTSYVNKESHITLQENIKIFRNYILTYVFNLLIKICQ